MREASVALVLLTILAACGTAAEKAESLAPPPKEGFYETAGSVEFGWRHIGCCVFGSVYATAIHPKNADIAIIGGDMGGAFKTADGAKTWKMIGESGKLPGAQPGMYGCWRTEFDPVKPDNVWIGSGHGLFKSEDCGETWRLVLGGSMSDTVGAIGIDPTDSNIVYAGQGGKVNGEGYQSGDVHKTTDGGKTWRRMARPGGKLDDDPIKHRYWFRMALDPSSPFVEGKGHQRLYLAGPGGFFVSEDAGESWTSIEENVPGGAFDHKGTYMNLKGDRKGPVSDMALVKTKEGKIELLIGLRPRMFNDSLIGGIYRSSDGGETWNAANNGISDAARKGLIGSHFILACSPSDPDRLYACTDRAVYGSNDGGRNWKSLANYAFDWIPKTPDFDGKDMYFMLPKKGGGGNFVKSVKDGAFSQVNMAVSASNPDVVLYGNRNGIGMSVDGGKTWDEPIFDFGEKFCDPPLKILEDRPPFMTTHKERSRGAQLISGPDAAFDPFDPRTIALAYLDVGLEISRDGGEWWEWAYNGILHPERGNARTVVYDPRVKGRMFVAGGGKGLDGPHVYQSDDGGKSFRVIGVPLLVKAAENRKRRPSGNRQADQLSVFALALDESLPADKVTLYAGSTEGAFKTEDGGATWTDVSGPLKGKNVDFLSLDGGRLVAGLIDDPQGEAGVYATSDGGATWERLGKDQIGGVNSLTVCRSNPKVIVVAAHPSGKPPYWTPRTPWRSDDGGATWREVDKHRCAMAAVHPEKPDTMYVATFARDVAKEVVGFYVTRDGGKTWLDGNKGLTFAWTMAYVSHRMAFDRKDPSRIIFLHDTGAWMGRDPGGK